ncbi:MAG: lipid-binding SYLF domain-containing protein [Pseudomonadota bacterium]|nr:lipid-binding SYLF domain-containing protein [Pseudomonadota bacterium]
MSHNLQRTMIACAIATTSWIGVAEAAGYETNTGANTTATPHERVSRNVSDAAKDGIKHAQGAADVLRRMQQAAGTTALLDQAKGVFVVPEFGRAAFGVFGVRGGVGVLMVRRSDGWSNPAFYDFGGVSVGLQAGVEAGSFVLVLNTDRAVQSFLQANNWSLNANAGLTVVNWSQVAQTSTGHGDITMWSDAKGLLAGVNLGLTDVTYDGDETSAFYGRQRIAANDALGAVTSSHNSDVVALKETLTGAPNATGQSAARTTHVDQPAAKPVESSTSRTR